MLYQAMAQYLDYEGFYGAAELYKFHSEEEADHAKQFMSYLQDKDVLPKIPALPAQSTDFNGLGEIVDMTYERELTTSDSINIITNAAMADKDHMTLEFLQGFMTEQREEEASALYWKDRVATFGSDASGLLLIDKEMLKKVNKLRG